MTNNPYSPPKSTLENNQIGKPTFYVVSLFKFFVMSFLTLGFYNAYWWYKNWKLYQTSTGRKIWPVARACGGVFLSYSLFQKINHHLRQSDRRFVWLPKIRALTLIAITIIGMVQGYLFDERAMLMITTLYACLNFYLFVGVQRAINRSENDPQERSNSRFTFLNGLAILLSFSLWGLVIIGLIFFLRALMNT